MTKTTSVLGYGNAFGGEIPTELGRHTDLERLSLEDNKLILAVPTELGMLGKTQTLVLKENQLCDDLPSQVAALTIADFSVSTNTSIGTPCCETMGDVTCVPTAMPSPVPTAVPTIFTFSPTALPSPVPTMLCVSGTYWDDSANECVTCAIGYYSNNTKGPPWPSSCTLW